MRIVMPGGTGHIGRVLVPALRASGNEVIVLSRRADGGDVLVWDSATLGPWADAIDGADAVINLAGRSVDCRYHKHNLTEMLTSRIDSTRVIGQAIEQAARPPRVWLQASTATIYAHTFDRENDEQTGEIGGREHGVPGYWRYSIEIAQAWERELWAANTPATRRVALRMAMVMSDGTGGVFDILRRLSGLGLGGTLAGGRQYMSWIHHHDLARAVSWLLKHDEIAGPINLAAPQPLPQRDFMRTLRRALHVPFGVPATAWMLEIAALIRGTDSELLLKSRRVVPRRLKAGGFEFSFPTWEHAVDDLLGRSRSAGAA